MSTCIPYGWGTGPWGIAPWGGSIVGSPGGPLPTVAPFDVFCIGPCGPMSYVLTYNGVSTFGDPAQFDTVPDTLDLLLGSGGTYPAVTGRVEFSTPVPQSFTLEWTCDFKNLPHDFSSLPNKHIFLGTSDASGNCAGLFVSQIGLCYTGSAFYDNSGNLVVNSTTQILAGSQLLINENTYTSFRLVVDGIQNLTYVYVTETAQLGTIGHQLRFVLPGIASASCLHLPVDLTVISFKGTAGEPVLIALDNICLGSGLVIPNLPPIANAGADQALRKCSIARLDGLSSFDPEGTPLVYYWQLVSAPLGSNTLYEGSDASTVPEPSPTGFTNKFRSQELADIHAITPIPAGTVIGVLGVYWTLTGNTGTDGTGFYFTVTEYTLPDNIGPIQAFDLLYQAGLADANTAQPTFYPDVAGIYKFELTVFDGLLYSSPSSVIINATESAVPRGLIPDASFLWNYLSDYWKLVDEKDSIDVFWSALSQVAASELLTLWQLDYSKSLRDVQRTFQRRWLHYDLKIPEPLIEVTTIRELWGGLLFGDFPADGTTALAGRTLILESNVFESAFEVTFPGGLLTGQDVLNTLNAAVLNFSERRLTFKLQTDRRPQTATIFGTVDLLTLTYGAGGDLDGTTFDIDINGSTYTITFAAPASAAIALAQINAIISAVAKATLASGNLLQISTLGTGAAVEVFSNSGGALVILGINGAGDTGTDYTYQRIRATGPFPLAISVASTTPTQYFLQGKTSSFPTGTAGGLVGLNVYRAEFSLNGLDIQEDDVLVLDNTGYRILKVLDDASDPWASQRLVLKEAPSSVLVSQASWQIPSKVTSKWIDFYNALVVSNDDLHFEVIDLRDASLQYIASKVVATCEQLPSVLLVDLTSIGPYISNKNFFSCYFADATRRRYMPLDDLVLDIPYLQEKINNAALGSDEEILRRNIDFYIERFRGKNCIRFTVGTTAQTDVWQLAVPPSRMWAETTYLDNNPTIEANFGIAVNFTLTDLSALSDNADYLSIVRGLWYSFFNGPTLYNLRVGSQILLGLPFAEEAGQIVEINEQFSAAQGRLLVQDLDDAAIVRSYTWPRPLSLETNPNTSLPYKLNDKVKQFAPLIRGVEILDYVKDPRWFEKYLQQGVFYEPEKFYRFLVRVDSAAFDLSALLFVQSFIRKVKPTYTLPQFVVLSKIADSEISIADTQAYQVRLKLYESLCGLQTAYMFDQPDPSPNDPGRLNGAYQNAADTSSTESDPMPTYPVSQLTDWGIDKIFLCPEDAITASMCVTYAVATYPTADSIYAVDMPIYTDFSGLFADSLIYAIPSTGRLIGAATTSAITATIDTVYLRIEGNTGETSDAFNLLVSVNGSLATLGPFTPTTYTGVFSTTFTVSYPVTAGDEIFAIIIGDDSTERTPAWNAVLVTFGVSVAWAMDTQLPAGTYCNYVSL